MNWSESDDVSEGWLWVDDWPNEIIIESELRGDSLINDRSLLSPLEKPDGNWLLDVRAEELPIKEDFEDDNIDEDGLNIEDWRIDDEENNEEDEEENEEVLEEDFRVDEDKTEVDFEEVDGLGVDE